MGPFKSTLVGRPTGSRDGILKQYESPYSTFGKTSMICASRISEESTIIGSSQISSGIIHPANIGSMDFVTDVIAELSDVGSHVVREEERHDVSFALPEYLSSANNASQNNNTECDSITSHNSSDRSSPPPYSVFQNPGESDDLTHNSTVLLRTLTQPILSPPDLLLSSGYLPPPPPPLPQAGEVRNRELSVPDQASQHSSVNFSPPPVQDSLWDGNLSESTDWHPSPPLSVVIPVSLVLPSESLSSSQSSIYMPPVHSGVLKDKEDVEQLIKPTSDEIEHNEDLQMVSQTESQAQIEHESVGNDNVLDINPKPGTSSEGANKTPPDDQIEESNNDNMVPLSTSDVQDIPIQPTESRGLSISEETEMCDSQRKIIRDPTNLTCSNLEVAPKRKNITPYPYPLFKTDDTGNLDNYLEDRTGSSVF